MKQTTHNGKELLYNSSDDWSYNNISTQDMEKQDPDLHAEISICLFMDEEMAKEEVY